VQGVTDGTVSTNKIANGAVTDSKIAAMAASKLTGALPASVTSSGVYLGGTGSANQLSDYEEGTWTPIFNQTSRSISSYTIQDGYYRKVGSQVTIWFALRATNSGSGNVGIGGLPFAPATGSPIGGGHVGSARASRVAGSSYMMEGIGSSGIGVIRRYDNNAFPAGAASILGFATYYTA